MFPGVVARTNAVVKLGPDLPTATTDHYAGYNPSGNVTGFSMMHETGTGGAPKYGVVSQLPVTGNINNPLASNLAVSRSATDQAAVGWYQTSLSNGVVTQLAATDHAGFFDYQFPEGQLANVVIDVSHVLPSFRGYGWGQGYAGGTIQVGEDGSYTGSGTYNNGWNLCKLQTSLLPFVWRDEKLARARANQDETFEHSRENMSKDLAHLNQFKFIAWPEPEKCSEKLLLTDV